MKQPVGTLKRLNVGVVLDDWQKTDADGKVTTSAMSDADIKRFTKLVQDAIGLRDDRGDKLEVLNQAFKNNAAAADRSTARRCGRHPGSRSWPNKSSARGWCCWWHSWCCGR